MEPPDAAATLASAGAILIDGDGRVAARWIAKDRVRATAPRRHGGAARPVTGCASQQSTSHGRAGAAEVPIDVGLTQVGPLSLGSLMLGVSRDGSTALQLEFGPEPTAIASFDIYGGTAGLRLSATLEVSRDARWPADRHGAARPDSRR